MTRDEAEARERTAFVRWTPRRVKLAGFAGLAGGFVGLSSLWLGATAVEGVGIGPTGAAVRMLHPVVYALFAVALVAADAQFGSGYGRRGRGIAVLFELALVGYAVGVAALVAGRLAFGVTLLSVGPFVGAAYLAMRLFGTLYGVSLWRHADVNPLTAGLFAILFPAIFVLGPLAIVGVPAAAIQAPLYLAFVALGYELLTVGSTELDSRTEVSG